MIVWEFDYVACSFVVQHWWWAIHIWDGICIIAVLGYITHPFWWIRWQPKRRLILEFGLKTGGHWVEDILEKWGLVTKETRSQDRKQE